MHETAGTGVTMPDWAQSLDQDAAVPQSGVDMDLVQRMQQQEEENRARIEAERLAAEQKREEAARQAAAAQATQPTPTVSTAPPQGAAPPPPPPPARHRVPKWPSALAALAVILIGGFIAVRSQSGGAPEPDAAQAPVETETPQPDAEPSDPAATVPDERITTYKVKPGDTLESIAEQVGKTPEEISRANGAAEYLIKPEAGQVINIP